LQGDFRCAHCSSRNRNSANLALIVRVLWEAECFNKCGICSRIVFGVLEECHARCSSTIARSLLLRGIASIGLLGEREGGNHLDKCGGHAGGNRSCRPAAWRRGWRRKRRKVAGK
jgi:hypothetical protein